MARKRMIDPEFWSDEKIGSLSQAARLLFIGMWNFADDEGIVKSRPEYLKSVIFPYDNASTEGVAIYLKEIEDQNLIFTYTINGQTFSIILNFLKHQTINKPLLSKLPKPSIQNRNYQEAIFKRDNWICHLCGDSLEGNYISKHGKDKMASIDHVIPQSKGGGHMPNNLKTACLVCNISRGNKDIPEIPEDYGSPTVEVSSQMKGNEEKGKEMKKILAAAEPAASRKKVFNPLGGEVIKAFEAVDPKNKTYYNNKTQRGACDFLLEEYGLEAVLKRISILSRTNKVNFFPTINSPNDLKEKWAKLQDAVDRKRMEFKDKKTSIIR